MILNRTVDDRHPLQKLTRYEVFRIAKAHGVTEIPSEQMPKPIMIDILRQKGISARSNRILGQPNQFARIDPHSQPLASAQGGGEKGVEIDAGADLARQWAAQQAQAPAPAQPAKLEPPAKSPAHMSIIDLGNEMKRCGIKRERRDNMITMKAKIEAWHKANG